MMKDWIIKKLGGFTLAEFEMRRMCSKDIKVGEALANLIQLRVSVILDLHSKGHPVPEIGFFTDNFGEVIEKLMILHIRAWHLENEIFDGYNDDHRLAETKKKLDVLWKKKRPGLVAALNRMIDDAAVHGVSLREDSVKLYKGFDGASADTNETLERVAMAIHDGWMQYKRSFGFSFGPRDPKNKTHPHFVPWSELDNATKQQDRNQARIILGEWNASERKPVTPELMHETWRQSEKMNSPLYHPHDRPFIEAHADEALEHEIQARLVNEILNASTPNPQSK